MSALHKKNQLSFNNLNKNSTFISDGELHKWVLQQASLAYDLSRGNRDKEEADAYQKQVEKVQLACQVGHRTTKSRARDALRSPPLKSANGVKPPLNFKMTISS